MSDRILDCLTSPLPSITAGLPGVGGQIKVVPEDFEVEEIPAYSPCGQGEFLYLWLEKRDLSAIDLANRLARQLDVMPSDVGTAGMKDKRAVTRQWVSLPAAVESRLSELDDRNIKILDVNRHTNKLKPGHQLGNRFLITVREVSDQIQSLLPPILERISEHGLPNYYGPQRFGHNYQTLENGLDTILGNDSGRRQHRMNRKLAFSAVQSALFNQYLAKRINEGLFRRVLAGDVMKKQPRGAIFRAEDVPAEQARFDARETVHCGPMFGKKMYKAANAAQDRELSFLSDLGLTEAHFRTAGKLLQGTRRPNLIYPEVTSELISNQLHLEFTLPSGSYATVLLDEIMK